ncbi:hypothetical protein F5I97DRAFT_1855305 [Phlebopus sp. FC_14]|nr:hypothetical protein F5I97DRAFT_1855305 [Phlebopus sp. FC_14]
MSRKGFHPDMWFKLKEWLLHSSSFCGCIPVRAGFTLLTVLTFFLSGALSVVIWFEVFHSYELSSKQKSVFILTGVVESILFLVSITGFVGVVVRKQLFVTIYTLFLYAHSILNLLVGIYFLITIRMSNRQQLVDECARVFVNTPTESDCSRLMNVSTYIFIAIVIALLLLELYGALIATRYQYRLRMQKKDSRSRRLGYFHALPVPTPPVKHTRQPSDNIELLRSRDSSVPYGDPDEEDEVLDIRPQPSTSYAPLATCDRELPAVPGPSPQASQRTISSDISSGRRVRALPPRPTVSPNLTGHAPANKQPDQQPNTQQGVLPGYPPPSYSYETTDPLSPESEDERQSLYTAEVSTNAHSALMAHAAYMHTAFMPSVNVPPVPKPASRSR